MSWLKRLQDGLAKTRKAVQQSFRKLTGTSIDADFGAFGAVSISFA